MTLGGAWVRGERGCKEARGEKKRVAGERYRMKIEG